MAIKAELAAELKDALRSGDKPRAAVIRQVETEVSRARSEPGFTGDVDDALYVQVIGSYTKKMAKAREEYLGYGEQGASRAEALAYEIEYLSRWLPTALGEDETRALVEAAVAELGVDDPKMAGRVVGHVMKSGTEGLDGALVNRIVREVLGAE
ncbi:MAG: GatB/YqeY domain-containing protein [Actinobacteria bacterium]|nr:GatB/YqeY domain-containing protein [Actinomycetota bacterium]